MIDLRHPLAMRRATMEEIGYGTDIFSLDDIADSQREYLYWLLGACASGSTAVETILAEDAADLLATKLRTPLQIQLHLALAFEAGFRTGERPMSAKPVESVLSRQLDDLEPTLTRHGYRIKDLVEQFDAKPAEIEALFGNLLKPERGHSTSKGSPFLYRPRRSGLTIVGPINASLRNDEFGPCGCILKCGRRQCPRTS
ncbi:hypothetical protein SAMN05216466_104454 [Paraburkholderia phenazinium]|uniref:ExeA-like protein n=1 Tax=Paraburkholderia phenazinium TaxID=60549 RepID=A0A1G7W8X7_9BURK|nr:hypothetical protein SAMN05216466_104454 [Paraburkholderia phenazinium]